MRTVRLGALIGVAVVSTAFAFGATNCASATTITLEVRTRPELCGEGELRLSQTGIAVTVQSKVDKPTRSPLQDFQKGCTNKASGSIGTLVITPSGSKTEEVAIRVVAALNDNSATNCDDSEGKALKNCIVTKRLTRFVPGSNVPVTIMIEPECNGVECPGEFVCVKGGNCAPVEAIPTNPDDAIDAAAVTDSQGVTDATAPKDAGEPDAGPCSRCKAPNGTVLPGRDCLAGVCTINCAVANANCPNSNVCVDDDRLTYVINCLGKASCQDTKCIGAKNKVTFNCEENSGDPTPHCDGIQCDGVDCAVRCDNIINTCINVRMAAKNNTMTCVGLADNRPTCDNVTCVGEKCKRTCGASPDAGCGTTSSCDAGTAGAGCKDFQVNDGGPPPP